MKRRAHTHPGFTLMELMTSMVIGSIILLLAASMLGGSGDSYEQIGGNVAAEREARALLHQLGADFSTAVFHADQELDESSDSWPADRIGFLCLQPDDAQTDDGRIGDLCAVSYYIEDLTIGGKTERCLMRGFRESADTFKALADGQTGTLFAQRPNIDEPLAFGVVSFELKPMMRDSAGQWTDWVKNDATGPEAFDVRLIVARRDLAGKLKTPGDWDGGGKTRELLGQPDEADRNENLEVYSTLIRFGNHANP